MLQILAETKGNLVAVKATNTLSGDDYDKLIPILDETLVQFDKLNLYFEMEDFSGWNLKSFWQDAKFDVQHASDFQAIAMIGEKKWQDWMTTFMKPFTSAEIKYFDLNNKTEAMNWVKDFKKVK